MCGVGRVAVADDPLKLQDSMTQPRDQRLPVLQRQLWRLVDEDQVVLGGQHFRRFVLTTHTADVDPRAVCVPVGRRLFLAGAYEADAAPALEHLVIERGETGCGQSRSAF